MPNANDSHSNSLEIKINSGALPAIVLGWSGTALSIRTTPVRRKPLHALNQQNEIVAFEKWLPREQNRKTTTLEAYAAPEVNAP